MKLRIQSFAFALTICILAAGVFPAAAQIKPITGDQCTNLGINCTGDDDETTLAETAIGILNAALVLIGVVALGAMIYGGVKYIISRGDSNEVEQAKQIIVYAIVGLVVIGLAAAIVNFAISLFES